MEQVTYTNLFGDTVTDQLEWLEDSRYGSRYTDSDGDSVFLDLDENEIDSEEYEFGPDE